MGEVVDDVWASPTARPTSRLLRLRCPVRPRRGGGAGRADEIVQPQLPVIAMPGTVKMQVVEPVPPICTAMFPVTPVVAGL